MSYQFNQESVQDYSHIKIVFKHVLRDYLNQSDYLSILSVSKIEEFDIAVLLGVDLRYGNDYAFRYASKMDIFQ